MSHTYRKYPFNINIGNIMSYPKDNYIIINSNSIIFTPSCKSRVDDSDMQIIAVTPVLFKKCYRYNPFYEQYESEIYIPESFSGSFTLYVYIDYREQGKLMPKCFKMEIECKNGIITSSGFVMGNHQPEDFDEEHINIRFPYQPWQHDLTAAWVKYYGAGKILI